MYKSFLLTALCVTSIFSNVQAQLIALPNGNVGIGVNPATQFHTTGSVRFQGMTGTGNRLLQTDATGVISPVAGGTTGQVLTQSATGLVWANLPISAWGLRGNNAIVGDFLGTINNIPLEFRIENSRSGLITKNNTLFGYQAGLNNTTGTENTFTGVYAGRQNTSGSNNTANGSYALYTNTAGNFNTAAGIEAGRHNTVGNNNTFIGRNSGGKHKTGNSSTYIGAETLCTANNLDSVTLVGAHSVAWAKKTTAIGAKTIASAESATALGFGAIASAYSATAIGDNATANNPNTVILGNVNNSLMRVGIGTTAPQANLHVSSASNPNIMLTNSAGSRLEMGVATCNGCYSSHTRIGNGVIRMINTNKIIFSTSVSGGNGGESSFVFADEDRVNMSIWNRGRIAIGNMTYAQTNANYALFTEKGILTEKLKLASQTSPDWASAPTAVLHTVGTVRHQNLPNGRGRVLVADPSGNVFLSSLTIDGMQENDANASIQLIEAQAKEIQDLKIRLERLEKWLSNTNNAPNDELQNIILEQNRPNPANDLTVIDYELPENYTQTVLKVADLNGKIMQTQTLTASKGSIEIHTSSWAEGTYFYSLVANGKVLKTKKLIVTKN